MESAIEAAQSYADDAAPSDSAGTMMSMTPNKPKPDQAQSKASSQSGSSKSGVLVMSHATCQHATAATPNHLCLHIEPQI